MKYRVIMAPNEGFYSAFNKTELEDFDQISKDFGWNLVDRSFNVNVYQLDQEATEALYNDDDEEMKILKKGVRGEIISISFSTLVIFFTFLFMSALFYSADIFYSNASIFMYPASLLILIFSLLSLGDYTYFKIKNKQAKTIRDLKFSKLSYSKFFVLLTCLGLIFAFSGLVSTFLTGVLKGKPGLALSLTLASPLLVYFSVKKVKRLNFKTKTKKFLIFAIVGLIILLSSSLNLNFIASSSYDIEKNLKMLETLKNFLWKKVS